MSRIFTLLGTTLGAAVVLALAVGIATALSDYETLPPPPAERYAAAVGAELSLVEAVARAEAAGGRAVAVEFLGGEEPAYRITIMDGERVRLRSVEAGKGAITGDIAAPWLPGEGFEGKLAPTGSGLRYAVLREGDGPLPPSKESTVKVHYSGWLVDGTKFDSSLDRGQPASFPLNRVIPGWTEGVGGMRVGEKRKLVIPYALAYGEGGRPPVIPPKATLIFDVELLEIVGSEP